MFIKICRTLDNESDNTMIECEEYRIQKDETCTDKKRVMLLTIKPKKHQFTNLQNKKKWILSGDMQVYALNEDGKTIDKIY